MHCGYCISIILKKKAMQEPGIVFMRTKDRSLVVLSFSLCWQPVQSAALPLPYDSWDWLLQTPTVLRPRRSGYWKWMNMSGFLLLPKFAFIKFPLKFVVQGCLAVVHGSRVTCSQPCEGRVGGAAALQGCPVPYHFPPTLLFSGSCQERCPPPPSPPSFFFHITSFYCPRLKCHLLLVFDTPQEVWGLDILSIHASVRYYTISWPAAWPSVTSEPYCLAQWHAMCQMGIVRAFSEVSNFAAFTSWRPAETDMVVILTMNVFDIQLN